MSSILASVFSSKLVRGTYPDEKAIIDFDLKGTKQEKKRITSLINRIAKGSEYGKSILEETSQAGYSISFDMQSHSKGYCCAGEKAIVLAPTFSDDCLIGVLAHEGRHAQQFVNGADERFGQRNIKTELMYFRTLEADAETSAATTCFEMKKTGDRSPWVVFEKSTPNITKAFQGVEKVTPDAMQKAFKGWFQDDEIKKAYEEIYINQVMKDALKGRKEADHPYNKNETSAEILTQICQTKNSCYFAGNLGALRSPEVIDISKQTFFQIDHFFAVRKMRTGQEPDTTHKNLPFRGSMQDFVTENSFPMTMYKMKTR